MGDRDTSLGGGFHGFPSTILQCMDAVRGAQADARREAWEAIARSYWKPVYCHLRIATGRTNEDAKDLTQAFFLWMQEHDLLARFDPDRGSFRGFLKGVLKNFVGNALQAEQRLKRGGDVKLLSLDAGTEPPTIPADVSTDPERAFDRAWMDTLVRESVDRVRRRAEAEGRRAEWAVFEAYDLASPSDRPTYAELGKRLGLEEAEVRRRLASIRQAVRDAVRAELLRGTRDRAQFEEEWHAFLGQ